ncbi:hypothetical protein B1no1_25040 [Thermolongibacillus altinsuensis]|nr:hypothetical protein B1no1_25040 [Thermolongibacillus altinsuensis]
MFVYERKQKTENGYESIKRTYRCTACAGCPFQSQCAKGKETTLSLSKTKNNGRRFGNGWPPKKGWQRTESAK